MKNLTFPSIKQASLKLLGFKKNSNAKGPINSRCAQMLRISAMAIVLSLAGIVSVMAQPPTITSFTPASGTVGSIVEITGTNFSSTHLLIHSSSHLQQFPIGGTAIGLTSLPDTLSHDWLSKEHHDYGAVVTLLGVVMMTIGCYLSGYLRPSTRAADLRWILQSSSPRNPNQK